MPGPPKKPRALRVLQGNPARRPLPRNEPQPRQASKRMAPPSALGAEGKREWRRISPELNRLGLLTVLDRTALFGYCDAYDRWMWALGLLKQTQDQRSRLRLTRAARQERRECLTFLREFGLSPASRAGVTAEVFEAPEKEGESFAEYLARRNKGGKKK